MSGMFNYDDVLDYVSLITHTQKKKRNCIMCSIVEDISTFYFPRFFYL